MLGLAKKIQNAWVWIYRSINRNHNSEELSDFDENIDVNGEIYDDCDFEALKIKKLSLQSYITKLKLRRFIQYKMMPVKGVLKFRK